MRKYYENYKFAASPGGTAIKPLKEAEDPAVPQRQRLAAIRTLAKISGGESGRGQVVFSRVCAACHMVGDQGKDFGPRMDMIGLKYNKEDLIKHILWPNEEIAKGYETVQVLTVDGEVINGFILAETDKQLKLGVATQDGKGKEVPIDKENIEVRKEMKASSMPEGLVKTIAPSEFLDLVAYVASLNAPKAVVKDGWTQVALPEVGALRKFGDFEEISRDAEVRYPKDFPAQWLKHSSLLLSGVDPKTREFAFHSPDPSASPSIVIRLAAESEVRHLTLQNRRDGFHERAKDLAVWLSADGEKWTQAWKSDKPSAMYEIDLPVGTKARYLKIGLDGSGVFHLNQVVVFGKK
jgi:putative heme-binding domain-containing protein